MIKKDPEAKKDAPKPTACEVLKKADKKTAEEIKKMREKCNPTPTTVAPGMRN